LAVLHRVSETVLNGEKLSHRVNGHGKTSLISIKLRT
jgi:hypothetical protein